MKNRRMKVGEDKKDQPLVDGKPATKGGGKGRRCATTSCRKTELESRPEQALTLSTTPKNSHQATATMQKGQPRDLQRSEEKLTYCWQSSRSCRQHVESVELACYYTAHVGVEQVTCSSNLPCEAIVSRCKLG